MCKYSLEAYAVRNAEQGETLVANQHSARAHGVFTQAGTRFDGPLTCVRDGQKLTFEKLEINRMLIDRPEWLNKYGFSQRALDYNGKRVVVELIDGRAHPSGNDCIKLARGVFMPINWITPGCEVYVGVKRKPRTLTAKLGLDDASLRIAALDMDPDPKPKDEEKKEQEPAPVEEPKPEAARLTRMQEAMIDMEATSLAWARR